MEESGLELQLDDLGFNCIVFGLHYPSILPAFLLSQLTLLCCPSLWEAATLVKGLLALPEPSASPASSLWPDNPRTAGLLGSGFPHSSSASGSSAWACCVQARAGRT